MKNWIKALALAALCLVTVAPAPAQAKKARQIEINVLTPGLPSGGQEAKAAAESVAPDFMFTSAAWPMCFDQGLDLGAVESSLCVSCVPTVYWEPVLMDGSVVNPDDVAEGKYNTYLRSVARQVRSLKCYIRILPAPQANNKACGYYMTGDQYRCFVEAVIQAFRDEKVTNALFVLSFQVCPSGEPFAAYWPTSRQTQCDLFAIGLEGENIGGWTDFDSMYYSSYKAAVKLAKKKPVLLTRIACDEQAPTGASKAGWIKDLFARVKTTRYKQVLGLYWDQFGDNKKFNSSPAALDAFRNGALGR